MNRFVPVRVTFLLGAIFLLAQSAAAQSTSSRKHTMTTHQNSHKTPEPGAGSSHEAHKGTDLVSLAEIDPTIIIDIQFSRPENPFHYQFFKENVAYVRYATAKKIAAVQRDLRSRGLGLKIWSAYRPMPVQIKMYEMVDRNGNWVSDPYDPNSKKAHVRGVAIDCTLVDTHGKELEMPTSYLDFHNSYKKMWYSYMDLPPEVIKRRALLKEVMNDHDMWGYKREWWHFQDHEILNYPAITMHEFPELHQKMLVDEMLHPASHAASHAGRK